MTRFEYGNQDSSNVLIQPVDEHDLSVMESEVNSIIERAGDDFHLVALKVNDWNRELSPWEAPAVFAKDNFGGKAADTLAEILPLTSDRTKTYYIGGYSLAGLFALWAVYQTDTFFGAASASPSVWFPGFTDYMKENRIRCKAVYLSLGDKEEKVRNSVMATVGNRIKEAYDLLNKQGISCQLEWNPGNHFKEPDIRTAKAFAWLLNEGKRLL